MVFDESCGCDVEDELVLEFDDRPGNIKGTKFSVLQKVSFPFWVGRGSRPLGQSFVCSLQNRASDLQGMEWRMEV